MRSITLPIGCCVVSRVVLTNIQPQPDIRHCSSITNNIDIPLGMVKITENLKLLDSVKLEG